MKSLDTQVTLLFLYVFTIFLLIALGERHQDNIIKDQRRYLHAVCEMAVQSNIQTFKHHPLPGTSDPAAYCDYLDATYDGSGK